MSGTCQATINFDLLNLPGKALGGGFKGFMPQSVITNDHDNSFAQERFTLKNAWNTRIYRGPTGLASKRIITPFRAVNNAGDILYYHIDNYVGDHPTGDSIKEVIINYFDRE